METSSDSGSEEGKVEQEENKPIEEENKAKIIGSGSSAIQNPEDISSSSSSDYRLELMLLASITAVRIQGELRRFFRFLSLLIFVIVVKNTLKINNRNIVI